eukprot:TRINITY_DN34343_c0_g1_i1.p1 TRINITY_DN34343_c0_g1~~TRINITY_DN34343_c0_g1_i1.p1  ORF type:complete len:381 (+),score=86.08 TRINITY_DN34343_c0_g1_i1:105-1247(+)
MPRGPGKKENYNLDYSRFNWLDREGADGSESRIKVGGASNGETPGTDAPVGDDDGPGLPEMMEMFRRMPPELQEAQRMLAISKENNDPVAQKRATKLVMAAVERGGPQIKKEFIRNLGEQFPELADQLSNSENLTELVDDGFVDAKPERTSTPEENINKLRIEMEKGAEAARQQMDALQKQQEQLERLKSPEDVLKFMHDGGMTEDDLRRMFQGDEKHMEECMTKMVEKGMNAGAQGKQVGNAEEALKATEQLHNSLCGVLTSDDGALVATGKTKVAHVSKVQRPEPPPPTIPPYRLQYKKDDGGRYTAVELRCTLPGVVAMDAIVLDVSDEHIRLSTVAPAPRYVVNAGPFPIAIDPSAARAKYIKKREELFISVQAKS